MEISSVQANHQIAASLTNAAGQAEQIKADHHNRELIQAVKKISSAELFGSDSELTFVLDRETRRPLVRIVDKETKEVIRQIPAEHVLRMAEHLKA